MIGEYKVAALCLSKISAENVQDVIYPLSRSLEAIGWKLTVYFCGTDLYEGTPFDEGEAAVYKLIDYRNIDALIIYDRMIHNKDYVQDMVIRAKMHDKPVIMIRDDEEPSGCIDVIYDEGEAFATLVDHLVTEHGVKNVACIAGRRDHEGSNRRIAVVREVLGKHNMTLENDYLKYGDFYDTPALAALDEILAARESLPDAIVCLNDTMAIAVCNRLMEIGYDVPEDVIVTGFDGIVQEQYNFPRLTTCRRNLNRFGGFLAKLIERANAGEEMKREYVFPYTLDVSESCGCRKFSMKAVGLAVNSIYSRMNNSAQYDRSMTNMLTKLTFEQDMEKVNEILRYYIRSDTYLCMNADFFHGNQNGHTYETEPFTEEVTSLRFFYGEENTEVKKIPQRQLVPDWNYITERTDPVVIYAVHNQQMVYGYLVVFANSFDYVVQRMHQFVLTLDSCVGMFVQQESLRNSNRRLQEIQNKIIVSFADMVESRDDFTGQHVKRTSEYLRILVKYLAEMPEYAKILTPEMQDRMCKAAPLHDIGKIKISDVVLNKPGKLTEDEFEVIKTHTLSGGEIIEKTLTDIESDSYLKVAQEMALYHHEKWDGSGYPYHLSGEEIPLCARIMAVVDVFDALTSKRVYKEAFPVEKAFRILEESNGTHFDPKIVGTFLAHKEEVRQVLTKYQDRHI